MQAPYRVVSVLVNIDNLNASVLLEQVFEKALVVLSRVRNKCTLKFYLNTENRHFTECRHWIKYLKWRICLKLSQVICMNLSWFTVFSLYCRPGDKGPDERTQTAKLRWVSLESDSRSRVIRRFFRIILGPFGNGLGSLGSCSGGVWRSFSGCWAMVRRLVGVTSIQEMFIEAMYELHPGPSDDIVQS